VACVAVAEGLCVTGAVQLGVRDAACTEGSSSSDTDAAQQVTVQRFLAAPRLTAR